MLDEWYARHAVDVAFAEEGRGVMPLRGQLATGAPEYAARTVARPERRPERRAEAPLTSPAVG